MSETRSIVARVDAMPPRDVPGLDPAEPVVAYLPTLDGAAAIWPDTRLRRLVDLVVAGTGLVLCGPILGLIGVLVRRTSAGPVLFRQVRVGRGGRWFRIWKFRTMTVDAASRGAAVSGRVDPRVTRVGRYLRPTRLDELPQLVNILRGEMTLIGPRPEVPRFVAYYTAEERLTLLVRPGLIGPGGLMFAVEQCEELDRAEDPDLFYIDHHLHPKLAADLAYLRDRRLVRDVRLVLAAAAALVGRRPFREGGTPSQRSQRVD